MYVTFYIKMSRLAATVVAVTATTESRHCTERSDCHRGVAATTVGRYIDNVDVMGRCNVVGRHVATVAVATTAQQ